MANNVLNEQAKKTVTHAVERRKTSKSNGQSCRWRQIKPEKEHPNRKQKIIIEIQAIESIYSAIITLLRQHFEPQHI